MGGVHAFKEALDTAPDWLEERDDLHYELQILDVLRERPGGLDRPLDEAQTLVQLYRALSDRTAQLERSRSRLIIARSHDRLVRYRARSAAMLRALAGLVRGARWFFSPGRRTRPVAAVIHMFYPDLAAEIRGYLENIPGPVDLFISTDVEIKRELILDAFSGWDAGTVEVRLAPNRGRDIGPKLITFRDVYSRYEYVLHLHSKKSAHASHLRLWRHFVYETLVGDPQIVSGILAAFEGDTSLGMVAPEPYRPVRAALSWGANYDLAKALAGRLGAKITPDVAPDFPAGSMFWARSAALRPLLDLDLRAEDFTDEAGQGDGTLAHAIERLYFVACRLAGFRWIEIARVQFAHARAATSTGQAGVSARRLNSGRPAVLILAGRRTPAEP